MIFNCRIFYGSRTPLVGRALLKRTWTRGRAQRSPEMLLAPFMSIQELRMMLGIDYNRCFRACKVSVMRGKYSWTDSHGRTFQAYNKRHVLVPFETAAYASKSFGFHPILVDPESSIIPHYGTCANAIPVVAVVGHQDHGKTSLIENITGRPLLKYEHGSTTQSAMCYTVKKHINGNEFMATFIDTPGQEIFDVNRGRAISLADVLVVAISTHGGQNQTSEVIQQADLFNVPVIFCFTKSDLNYVDRDICKRELSLQCSSMKKEGLISRDFIDEIDAALFISCMEDGHSENIDALIETICKTLVTKALPTNPVVIHNTFGGEALQKFHSFTRRPNCLVLANNFHDCPYAIGFILEVEKTHSHGIVMTVIVRHGELVEGNYFLSGTEYGRITGIYPADMTIGPVDRITHAPIGYAVKVTGLKNLEGTSNDDLLLVLSQLDAYRLSCYRKSIARLRAQQTAGPPLECYWSMEAKSYNSVEYLKSEKLHEQDNTSATEVDNYANNNTSNDHTTVYLEPLKDGQTAESTDYDSDCYYKDEIEEHNVEIRKRWRDKLPPETKDSEDKVVASDKSHVNSSTIGETVQNAGKLVIPLVLRTSYAGTLDALLDTFEQMEQEYNVRIPLVHGGIGPISPNDIVQAHIGSKFTYCPVYAFQVPVLVDAAKHAIVTHVHVKQYNVYRDIIQDVRKRCIDAIAKQQKYG